MLRVTVSTIPLSRRIFIKVWIPSGGQYLHQKTGEALEALASYPNSSFSGLEAGAANLAWHFEQAGLAEKAADYLLRAGRQAYAFSSNEQAIAFYQRGIRLISGLPVSQSCLQNELSLQIALQAVLQSDMGYAIPEVGQACARAVELAYQAGDCAALCASLFSLATFYFNQAEYGRALDLAGQLDSLAASSQEVGPSVYARLTRGLLGIFRGDFEVALQHLRYVIASPPWGKVEDFLSPLFQDIRLIARIFIGLPLWFLGYPDQADQAGDDAIRSAQALGHLQSLGLAYGMAGIISVLRRDCYKTRDCAQSLFGLSKAKNLQSINGLAAIFLGRYLTEQGQMEEAFATLQDGLIACHQQGVKSMSTMFLAMQAEACHNPQEGLSIIASGLDLARESGERFFLAELYRIRGELLLAGPGTEAEAIASFRRARLIARMQGARSLALRVAMSRAGLFAQQHQTETAYSRLKGLYEQFSEGFDTPDLRRASRLLAELSSNASPDVSD